VSCGSAGCRGELKKVKGEGASTKYTGWKVTEEGDGTTTPQIRNGTRQEPAKENKKGKRKWELRLRKTIIEGKNFTEETSRKRKRGEEQVMEASIRMLIGGEIELAIPRDER